MTNLYMANLSAILVVLQVDRVNMHYIITHIILEKGEILFILLQKLIK